MLSHAPSRRFRLTSLFTAVAGLLAAVAILAGGALAHGAALSSHHRHADVARIACRSASRHRRRSHAGCIAGEASKRKSAHPTRHGSQPAPGRSSRGGLLSQPALPSSAPTGETSSGSPTAEESSSEPVAGQSPSAEGSLSPPAESPSSPPAKESSNPPAEALSSSPAKESPSSPAEAPSGSSAEEPSSESAVVNATPTGPASPAGGWHVAFADGFGAQIGTGAGQDNFWYPNEGECCAASKDHAGNNSDEL